ncbi:hypothetical protein F5876DRAFT_80835 [Lentinula aff. lateritia]|uniref:Uncharacterized protein n=1 Tax=Lentinula aff. lateritia TaxID=2804960 RepID=A0ACC1TNY0_9AGAR|nr:hypothetical protein F5876DRAFT_80835 [Lentinula aff. lateritia]
MRDAFCEKEELWRVDAEAQRNSKDKLTILRRKVDQHNEIIHTIIQILHNGMSLLQPELGQIKEQNATLTKDNTKLLQQARVDELYKKCKAIYLIIFELLGLVFGIPLLRHWKFRLSFTCNFPAHAFNTTSMSTKSTSANKTSSCPSFRGDEIELEDNRDNLDRIEDV